MSPLPVGGDTTRAGSVLSSASSQTVPEERRAVASVTVPNRVESVRPAVAFILQISRVLKVVAAVSNPLFEVAVAEAIANAVKHGRDSHADDSICCEVELSSTHFLLRIVYGGKEFVLPAASTLPDVDPSDTELLPESGYGVPIMLSVFSAVRPIRVRGRFGLELGLPLAR